MFRSSLIKFLSLIASLATLAVAAPENHQYASPGGHTLTLDLYLPDESAKPSPVVIFVHGGGWKNGSRKTALKRASWLSEHGFAVAGIDYRLTDVAQWPAQIDDCYAAVRWLRSNADRFNLDPSRIGAWGTSAGGHLVALMGTRAYPGDEDISSQVQAVCDWFGPSDLLTMPPNNVGFGRTREDVANSNGAKLLGATVREVPDLAKDASAYFQVSPRSAPFLIMHGDQDPGVPLIQSQKLHSKLMTAGVSSKLVVIEGGGHGGPLFNTDDAKKEVLSFFQSTLQSDES
ncbi:MAG: alpha/beta hydrolase [Verrucomicrobiota bacterium]